jgi:hypothetical protein
MKLQLETEYKCYEIPAAFRSNKFWLFGTTVSYIMLTSWKKTSKNGDIKRESK